MKYTSTNGYTGKLYGEHTLEIFDRNGKTVFKTNSRTVNTFGGLKHEVDTFPQRKEEINKMMTRGKR